MAEEKKHWHSGRGGPALAFTFWFIGWLFTVGYLGLLWWQIILAIVIWPYYLGRALGA